MDISFAILGLLSWQPLSGYDLKKIIAESELFYWSGNNNQIYNSLVELHKDGLVTQKVQQQESLPAKKIYSITEAGRGELEGWLHTNPELPDIRSSFLIQLAFAGTLPGADLDALLTKYEEEIAAQVRMRQTRHARPDAAPNRTRQEQYIWEKINERLIAAYACELAWVREVRAGLRGDVTESSKNT